MLHGQMMYSLRTRAGAHQVIFMPPGENENMYNSKFESVGTSGGRKEEDMVLKMQILLLEEKKTAQKINILKLEM